METEVPASGCWDSSAAVVKRNTVFVWASLLSKPRRCFRCQIKNKTSDDGLKTNAITCYIYSALTHTRYHTRRIPGVPGSTWRRLVSRGYAVIEPRSELAPIGRRLGEGLWSEGNSQANRGRTPHAHIANDVLHRRGGETVWRVVVCEFR